LAIGDVVIAEQVIQHDAGMLEKELAQPYQPGHVPFINPTDRMGYPTDPDPLALVKDRLRDTAVSGQIANGTVLSGAQYLNGGTTRDRRNSRSQCGLAIGRGGARERGCAQKETVVFGARGSGREFGDGRPLPMPRRANFCPGCRWPLGWWR
jgi:adenosylhomocysteine nucleosidase